MLNEDIENKIKTSKSNPINFQQILFLLINITKSYKNINCKKI